MSRTTISEIICTDRTSDYLEVFVEDDDDVWCEVKDGPNKRQVCFGSIEDAMAKLGNAQAALINYQQDEIDGGLLASTEVFVSHATRRMYTLDELVCWYQYDRDSGKWVWLIGEEDPVGFTVIRYAKADTFNNALSQQKRHLEQLTGVAV